MSADELAPAHLGDEARALWGEMLVPDSTLEIRFLLELFLDAFERLSETRARVKDPDKLLSAREFLSFARLESQLRVEVQQRRWSYLRSLPSPDLEPSRPSSERPSAYLGEDYPAHCGVDLAEIAAHGVCLDDIAATGFCLEDLPPRSRMSLDEIFRDAGKERK